MAKRKYFLEGFQFHNFTVGKFTKGFFECKCICGTTRKLNGREITSGRYKSCGCKSNPNRKEYLENFKNQFWKRVKEGKNGCLEWTGNRRNGYGRVGYKRRLISCHRLVWEWSYGKIKKGKIICHSCDNPACVNVKHLFLGTQDDNMKDSKNKGRQSKKSGFSNPNAKLNEKDVKKILCLIKKGINCEEIAKKFSVCKTTIWRIKSKYLPI